MNKKFNLDDIEERGKVVISGYRKYTFYFDIVVDGEVIGRIIKRSSQENIYYEEYGKEETFKDFIENKTGEDIFDVIGWLYLTIENNVGTDNAYVCELGMGILGNNNTTIILFKDKIKEG